MGGSILESDIEWLFGQGLDYKELNELIVFSYEITDELEVCVRIAPSKKFKEQIGDKEQKSIFYFEDMFEHKQLYLN